MSENSKQRKYLKDKLKSNYLLICIVILFSAMALGYLTFSIEMQLKTIKYIDTNGKIVSKEILSFPIQYYLYNLLSVFLFTLSASIFISVFIINRIEIAQKEKLKDEIKELRNAVRINVFDSLFKKIVPDELFHIIKKDIILNKIIRRNAKWIYKFTETSENKIELEQTLIYTLQNLSDKELNDPIIAETIEGHQVIKFASCTDENDQVDIFYDHNKKDNKANVRVEGDRKIIRFTVIIPKRKHVVLNLVLSTIYSSNLQDEFFTKTPLINAALIATFPQNYKFSIFPMSSSEFNCTLKNDTQHIYEIKGALFPYQGFVYYLSKKNSLNNENEIVDNE